MYFCSSVGIICFDSNAMFGRNLDPQRFFLSRNFLGCRLDENVNRETRETHKWKRESLQNRPVHLHAYKWWNEETINCYALDTPRNRNVSSCQTSQEAPGFHKWVSRDWLTEGLLDFLWTSDVDYKVCWFHPIFQWFLSLIYLNIIIALVPKLNSCFSAYASVLISCNILNDTQVIGYIWAYIIVTGIDL